MICPRCGFETRAGFWYTAHANACERLPLPADLLTEYRGACVSQAELARKYGVCNLTIRRHLDAAGVSQDEVDRRNRLLLTRRVRSAKRKRKKRKASPAGVCIRCGIIMDSIDTRNGRKPVGKVCADCAGVPSVYEIALYYARVID